MNAYIIVLVGLLGGISSVQGKSIECQLPELTNQKITMNVPADTKLNGSGYLGFFSLDFADHKYMVVNITNCKEIK